MEQLNQKSNSDIVVGLDGSEASLAALEWAIGSVVGEQAIRLVAAYPPRVGEDDRPARSCAQGFVDTTLAVVRKRHDVSNLTFVSVIEPGEPVEVLLANAENSRLLVLGRHGTSGIIHNALGSVGDACARMATCPVVIVPPVKGGPSVET